MQFLLIALHCLTLFWWLQEYNYSFGWVWNNLREQISSLYSRIASEMILLCMSSLIDLVSLIRQISNIYWFFLEIILHLTSTLLYNYKWCMIIDHWYPLKAKDEARNQFLLLFLLNLLDTILYAYIIFNFTLTHFHLCVDYKYVMHIFMLIIPQINYHVDCCFLFFSTLEKVHSFLLHFHNTFSNFMWFSAVKILGMPFLWTTKLNYI